MVHTFEEVLQRVRTIEINAENFDMLVAIANGGIIPAAMINQRLMLPIHLLKIHLKDENQKPLWDTPRLIEPINFDFKGKRILLVDDRIKSGKTIVFARELLREAASVHTFAVNGNADYALYNEACFKFPWCI
ncbi:MAG: phosphoribosyltransferase [Bacteroidales bacterium]|nr:phosphoribosyltransferase [Bacteroidales bacterium]